MTDTLQDEIHNIGRAAKTAAQELAKADTAEKNHALRAAAKALRARSQEIITANKADLDAAHAKNALDAFIDRLKLDEGRIEGIASAVEAIAELPDPVGRTLTTFDRPNGLNISRVAVPLGVIGMVFESRPNVGADAGALCLKSGNAVILRGGSDSLNSTREIVGCMREGLKAAGLPENVIQTVPSRDRAAVKYLLQCTEFVDLVIPRGGKGLVQLVKDQARVPTLLHLDGNCHSYIHEDADLEKAVKIVRNAKLRRTGICGATESLVIDQAVAAKVLPKLLDGMPECEFRGDKNAAGIDSRIKPANDEDFGLEYLDSILSVKIVDGLDTALDFVAQHSSGHTDAIITEDQSAANAFLKTIDAAVVMHNASTQFSDGGEFGMGAEIGIATGKLHARGPVGLEQLTSYKYIVRGEDHVRA